jgi:hypothetical protein
MNLTIQDIDLSSIMGACLGACFYILMKLQPYLENRSFDPKYNSAYATRFVIGMVAGVIIAYVWSSYISQPVPNPKTIQESARSFSPGVVGILGGFSAEAVQQILQRLVEVLLSLVRGDNSAQVQSKLNAQQSSKFADVRDKLDDIDKAKTDDERKTATDAVKALLKKADC